MERTHKTVDQVHFRMHDDRSVQVRVAKIANGFVVKPGGGSTTNNNHVFCSSMEEVCCLITRSLLAVDWQQVPIPKGDDKPRRL